MSLMTSSQLSCLSSLSFAIIVFMRLSQAALKLGLRSRGEGRGAETCFEMITIGEGPSYGKVPVAM